MTDTDKLKRLAEAAKKVGGVWECSTEEGSDFIEAASPGTILTLIAENDRLRGCDGCGNAIRQGDPVVAYHEECSPRAIWQQRDEAVALLRKVAVAVDADGGCDLPDIVNVWDFLARIDAE